MHAYKHDAFISHASEDKAAFVQPLALELVKLGLVIWYDAFSLEVGDSLHESIEAGLAQSSFGIVVFSPSFFAKNWTKAELAGLFGRQMNEANVILPIWHNVSAEQMQIRYPILADIKALSSSDGFAQVAFALVRKIRPALLAVQDSRNAAALVSQRMAEAVEREFPGFSIQVTTGSGVKTGSPAAREGLLASFVESNVRTDILLRDATQIPGGKPQISLSFNEAGASKMEEALRTGKPQEFLCGEFTLLGGNLPLMPSAERIAGSTLQLQSNVNDLPVSDVRVEVRHGNKTHLIPIMRMTPLRCGSDEIELEVRHTSQPFTFRFPISMTISEGGEANFQTSFSGFDFAKIQQCIEMIDDLLDGANLEVFDIASGRRFVGMRFSATRNWIPRGVAELVSDVAELQRFFGLTLIWPTQISNADVTRISFLRDIIRGEEVGTNLQMTATCQNTASFREQLKLWKATPMRILVERPDNNQVSPIFGVELSLPRWGYVTEQVVVEDIEAVENLLESSPVGETVEIKLRGITPTYVRLVGQVK